MLARRRSHRAYRVYEEDAFLAAEDPTAEGETASDSQFVEPPPYTAAARRGLPGPLGGRAGVVLIALVAMAVSALVVHAVRAGLEGGGGRLSAAGAPATAAAGAATAAGRSTRAPGAAQGGTHVQDAAPRAVSRARDTAMVRSGAGHFPGHRPGRRAARAAASEKSAGAGQGPAEVVAASLPVDVPGAASAIPAAAPEFGFER